MSAAGSVAEVTCGGGVVVGGESEEFACAGIAVGFLSVLEFWGVVVEEVDRIVAGGAEGVGWWCGLFPGFFGGCHGGG